MMSGMTAQEVEATKRMQQARMNLTYYQPFFGTLLLHLKPIMTRDVPTMAVDGKSLWWNPDFVMSMSKLEVEGVQAHEAMHCALLHFVRMETRDPNRWNQATDFAINRELLAGKFQLPGEAITFASPPGARGHLFDPQYDGMTAERIYPLMPVPPPPMGGGEGGGDPSGGGEKGVSEAVEGSMIGDVIKGAVTAEEAADMAVTWEIRVRQAVAQADKHAGFVPGAIREMIDKLNNPLIDWRTKMRGFVGSACAVDVSWSRPSRRFPDAIIPSRPYDAVSRILFMIDTSGSMDKEALRAGLSEGEGILNEGGVASILWACIDTRVASHGEIRAGDTFQDFTASGRGGTHFKQPMQWASEHAADVAAIVVFTDGATGHWGDDPGKPVLWVGALSDEKWLSKAPYGEVCLIDLEAHP